MELAPGLSIGPYRLIEPAGAGGMAEVWRAYHPRIERYVAIKFLSPRYASDPSYLDRFVREARAISRLDHPNILTILDFGEQDHWTYMVSPFIGGGTLSERLQRGPWPLPEALAVLEPLGDALDHAHANGIVHRDVKPSNVLFTEAGRLVLSDFGVARMVESSTLLSQAGLIIGTPMYMSPEQAEGQPASPASDIYSLGVVAYQLLTGRPPFAGETPLALLRAHTDRPLPPPRTINPALSPEIEGVLFRVLAKDPADRIDSGAAFAGALRVSQPATLRTHARAGSASAYAASTSTVRSPVMVAPPLAASSVAAPPPPPNVGAAATAQHGQRPVVAPSREMIARRRLLKGVGAVIAAASVGGLLWTSSLKTGGSAAPASAPATTVPTPPAMTPQPPQAVAAPPTSLPTSQPTSPTTSAPTAQPAAPPQPTATAVPKPATWQVMEALPKENGASPGPHGMAVDQADNLYVLQQGRKSVRKFAPSGQLIAEWPIDNINSSDLDGGLAVDGAGNLYTATTRGYVIKLNPTGQEVTRWVLPDLYDGYGNAYGVAVDAAGDVYVAGPRERILKYSPTGALLTMWGSDQGAGPARFQWPWGLGVDRQGNLYVSGYNDHCIFKVSPAGQVLAQWGSIGFDERGLFGPRGLTLDREGNVYLSDSGNSRIVKFNSKLERIQSWGGKGDAAGQFSCGDWIAVDSRGVIYVSDACFNQRIQRFSNV